MFGEYSGTGWSYMEKVLSDSDISDVSITAAAPASRAVPNPESTRRAKPIAIRDIL